MRVLFAGSPGLGHMLPMVPLAWAMRAAGHEVLLALAGRGSGEVPAIAASGLPVVQVAEPGPIRAAFQAHLDRAFPGFGPREIQASIGQYAWDPGTGEVSDFSLGLFARLSEVTVDATVALARRWRPDLVVHTPLQATGPLVAALLGVPAIEHGFGFSTRADTAPALAERLAASYRRHGVTPESPRALISVAPPSTAIGDAGLPMRYVTYNGGVVLPEWLLDAPRRPRVVVTLGSMLPGDVGLGPVSWITDVAPDIDAEFVLALGDADVGMLGPLPANIRPVSWIPLQALLPGAAAVVHHGGAGSTMSALVAGVPQLVMPLTGDTVLNAQAVVKRGLGTQTDVQFAPVSAADIRQLIEHDSFSRAARDVRAEALTMPTPAQLVDRLAAFTEVLT